MPKKKPIRPNLRISKALAGLKKASKELQLTLKQLKKAYGGPLLEGDGYRKRSKRKR
jgi:hypothetical protein